MLEWMDHYYYYCEGKEWDWSRSYFWLDFLGRIAYHVHMRVHVHAGHSSIHSFIIIMQSVSCSSTSVPVAIHLSPRSHCRRVDTLDARV